jgi:hypothetical protein
MRTLSTFALAVAVSLAVIPVALARDDDHADRKNIRDEHVQVHSDDRDHNRADERRLMSRYDHDNSRDRDNSRDHDRR